MSSRFGKRRKRLQRAGRLEALPYCRGNVRVRATGCQYFFFDFGYQSAGLAENQNSSSSAACAYRKSHPAILMVQSAQDRAADEIPGPPNAARDRGILVQ
jgi:hypothetical protein